MPQNIVDTNGLQKTVSSIPKSPPSKQAFQRPHSGGDRNASGQKKKALCGNAMRW